MSDEKIRLVLETLGVDNVRQATKTLRELEKGLDDVGKAASQATGKGGMNGQGLLQLSYFIDDMQYGMRGIMNNIPTLAMSLGLGAGLAGAAGVAAVAIGQLTSRHPEWFEWSKKVKEKLDELTESIKAEEAAVKRQREAVDKLGESNSTRIEDIIKLKTATEDLKVAEEELATNRKNAKAAEDAAKNAGVIATDELTKQKDVVKSVITDAGLQQELLKSLASEIDKATPGIDEAGISTRSRKLAEESVGSAAFSEMGPEQRAALVKKFTQSARAEAQFKRGQEIRTSTQSIFGGLINPANQAEMDRAMSGLDQFLPGVSQELRGVYQFDRESEQFDAALTKRGGASAARRRAAAEAQKALDAGMAPGSQMRGLFEASQNQSSLEARKRAEDAMARNADIRNQVLSQFDPAQLAARRLQMAGTGPFARKNLAGLENQDLAQMSQIMADMGMAPGDAGIAARETLQGGKNQLSEFAKLASENTGRTVSLMEASNMLLNKAMQDAEIQRQRIDALEQQATINAQMIQAPARPQMFRANH